MCDKLIDINISIKNGRSEDINELIGYSKKLDITISKYDKDPIYVRYRILLFIFIIFIIVLVNAIINILIISYFTHSKRYKKNHRKKYYSSSCCF